MRPAIALLLTLALCLLWGELAAEDKPPKDKPPAKKDLRAKAGEGSDGCLKCHLGIEEMHPNPHLSCVDCHGGNADGKTKDEAHVKPKQNVPNDERTLPYDYDPAYLRFVNPSNLRVVHEACGFCHDKQIQNLEKSLHSTTAGHLSDGLYENGASPNKHTFFSIFPIEDKDGDIPPNGLKSLRQIPAFSEGDPHEKVSTNFKDTPRKNCMRCHLWSRGQAVQGRLGQDGDYRSEGCATCHVTYDDTGLSRTGDRTVKKFEPGHPLIHRFTNVIPTQTCVHCHYGDAAIGLQFRGMAQLVPGMPAGPDVPGTTAVRLNGAFYLNDPKVTPPDIHHERGMACIDCHTVRDVMGDGNMYGEMEHAVEIECTDCHGTLTARATGKTQRGFELKNLKIEGTKVTLHGKVDGKDHPVKQIADVVSKGAADYNAKAAAAMTEKHLSKMECYACHEGWSTNFFGFHFDRNEQFHQLDILSGERTCGRTNTLEKVFSTFKGYYLGVNSEGMIAPFMVGFSTFTSVHAKDGRMVLDQAMPETAAGLSGMTMIHHQVHTTRPQGRACVECHRSSTTWGMGSLNFRLTRDFGFATTSQGLEVIGVDRRNIERSLMVATLPIKGAVDVAIVCDPVQGHAKDGYVACGDRGIVIADLRVPTAPRVKGTLATTNARGVLVAGSHLFVADGAAGVKVFDLADPAKPKAVGEVKTKDARGLYLQGLYLYVADGAGGLAIVDVGDLAAPKVVRSIKLADADDAKRVVVFFHYSRPTTTKEGRTRARQVAYVANGSHGIAAVDVTEPTNPARIEAYRKLMGEPKALDVVSLVVNSHYDLGSEGGRIPSVENDYLYAAYAQTGGDDIPRSYVTLWNVSDPEHPRGAGSTELQTPDAKGMAIMKAYNAPFVSKFVLAGCAQRGVVVDVTKTADVNRAASIDSTAFTGGLVFEEMPFDQMIDEDGRQLKDISHDGARYLTREEVLKVLRVPLSGTYTESGK